MTPYWTESSIGWSRPECSIEGAVNRAGVYSFAHALLQEAAYLSLLHSTRQEYHRLIAESLEARFPEFPRLQPEVLAHHYSQAAISEKAAHYWLEAGKLAIKHSANIEAASHLRKGIEVCKSISPQEKQERWELNFQSLLGSVLAATEGYANPDIWQYTREAKGVGSMETWLLKACRQTEQHPAVPHL